MSFTFPLPPPSFSPSSGIEEHDRTDGSSGNSCSYSELRGKMIFDLDISEYSQLFSEIPKCPYLKRAFFNTDQKKNAIKGTVNAL